MKERVAKNIRSRVISAGDVDLHNPKDRVVEFIQRLTETEAHLKLPVSWTISHGRRRTISNMRIVREERESQLRTTQDALRILGRMDFSEITFFENMDGKIVGFKVDHKEQN